MNDRGKCNKWPFILQKFELKFVSEKLKKSLVFYKLMSYLPCMDEDEIHEDSFVDEHIFLISSTDPWYGDIIIYLETLRVPYHLSRDEQWFLHHNSKNYLIIGDTLYRWGVDSILRRCLTHDEA